LNRIKAILFDLDGVLVETDQFHYDAWKWLCDANGWEFDHQVNQNLRGVPRMASLQIILDHNNVSKSQEEMDELAALKNAHYCELITHLTPDNLLAGVLPFLKEMKKRGVKMCICSSSKNAHTILDKLEIARFFDSVVTGNDIKRAKPDPEIFCLGARRLNVSPSECVVFEDAASGVHAAKSAKMICVGINRHGHLNEPCETIVSFDDIDIDALLSEGRTKRLLVDPWKIIEDEIEPGRVMFFESIFALSNGYMGLRGSMDEDVSVLLEHSYPGFFLNGVYDYASYKYEVPFVNLAPRRHCVLNMCDWSGFDLTLGDERFDPTQGRLLEYRRELDMRQGALRKMLVWESPSGRRVQVRSTRIVSMVRRHIAAMQYEVTPLNFDGDVAIESRINGKVESRVLPGDHLDLLDQKTDGDLRLLHYRTRTDHIGTAMTFCHQASADAEIKSGLECSENIFSETFSAHLQQGDVLSATKTGAFYTSLECDPDAIVDHAIDDLNEACGVGFDQLLDEQTNYWSCYWNNADIEIDGAPRDQQAIRFNLFQLAQSLPNDSYRSISANGQTGDHYSGCVFWDTEILMVPQFVYTNPQAVKSLLEYRYDRLEHARSYARHILASGASYPIASISGEDIICVPEGPSTEYHVNCAISRAIWQYWSATGDEDFLLEKGAEILFETSRFFLSIGQFVPNRDNQFCINSVTGPDEYAVGVNNNCYTNAMVQWHLRFACAVYDRLKNERPECYEAMVAKIGLEQCERDIWWQAADRMYIPFNEELGIHEQDDSFLYLAPVDMDLIPKYQDIQMDYPPANLRRMPVVKQADVVLLMFTLGDQFSLEQKRLNYEYYEPRTNHGSSLSPGVHSILAAELGKVDEAYRYFEHTALLDLLDLRGNVSGGLHLACIGTAWMAVVNGFAGMRDYADKLIFNPVLPRQWEGYRFKLFYRGRRLEVEVTKSGADIRLLDGNDVSVVLKDREIDLRIDLRNPIFKLA